jgi:hypothetical protein
MRKQQLWSHVALCALLGGLLAGCSWKKDVPTKNYRMGERAQAGTLVYTIYETEWKPQLGEGPSAKIPTNRFLILRFTVTNTGRRDSDVPQMVLVDEAGNSYQEVVEAPEVPRHFGVIRTVKPAQTEEGRVVFDVPMASYKLRVSSDPDAEVESAALIAIPLQFQATQPDTVQ